MVGNADSFYCGESNFELVFSHALFEHLSDPEKTLKHLRDYLRLGGLIAVRSQDWGGFVLHPETSAVSRALETYQAIQSNYGGDVHCGRKLGMYLRSDSRPDPGDMSSSLSSSSVTGISSQLEDNSSQSSTAKTNLSAVESLCSSGIVSLIMPTRVPYSGPSRNWEKASRSGRGSIVLPLLPEQTSIALEMQLLQRTDSFYGAGIIFLTLEPTDC